MKLTTAGLLTALVLLGTGCLAAGPPAKPAAGPSSALCVPTVRSTSPTTAITGIQVPVPTLFGIPVGTTLTATFEVGQSVVATISGPVTAGPPPDFFASITTANPSPVTQMVVTQNGAAVCTGRVIYETP